VAIVAINPKSGELESELSGHAGFIHEEDSGEMLCRAKATDRRDGRKRLPTKSKSTTR